MNTIKFFIIAILAFILTCGTQAATNLVNNPGFESGLTSWTNNGNASYVKTPASGIFSARVGKGQGGVSQNIMSRLTAGKTYNFSAYAKLGTISVGGIVSIRFKNSAGSLISEKQLPITKTSYAKYSVDVTVPVNSAIAEVYAFKKSGALSYLYVDDFSVTEVVVPTLPPTPTTGYIPMGVGGGGAMGGISISPYANLWFVGTDMGTLYRSTDLGKSWAAVNQYQAIFDADLTKAISLGFSSDGVTVFHSTAGVRPKISLDSGVTFSNISMGLVVGEYIKYWESDSSNANIMFAATNMGLLKTSNKGSTWLRISGITEEAIGTFIDQNSATKRLYHATKTKVLYSDDGGISFTTYWTPTTAIRQFTGGSDASGVTLALGDSDGTNACSWVYSYLNDWGPTSIDQTVADCGYVWINKNNSGFVKNNQIVGDHLKMAENDSTTLYTTGGSVWIRQYGTKVHVSHDKGATWTLKLNQFNNDVIPYAPWPSTNLEYSAVALDIGWWDNGYVSFAINQRNSNVVAGTGYFFLHSTLNGGNNWLAPFTKFNGIGTPTKGKTWKSTGLEVTTVYKTKFHPTNPSLLYAAMADISGVVSEDHGASFRITKPGFNSIYDYAFDPNDDMVVFAATGAMHDFPNEWHANVGTGNGGLYKSINRGGAWTRITPNDINYNRQFLSVGYDAKNDIIYGGTQEIGIVSSADHGLSWAPNNAGMPVGNKIIPQIEIDPKTGNAYALLTGDAPSFTNQAYTGVYFLDVQNGATSWVLLRGTVNYPIGADPGYKVWWYPTSFAVDFNSNEGDNTIYLTDYENHGNWLMTGVWKTTNKGATWNRMKQFTHATEVKIDPQDSNKIYVAGYHQLDGTWGDGGELYSKDGGATWLRNGIIPYQGNSRGVTLDPLDSTKILYSFFGGGMLYGQNPNM